MQLRLFFAVNFNEEIRKRIFEITKEFKKFNEMIKYEPIEKLHLTLLFLGNVDESLLRQLNLNAKQISEKYLSTEVRFNGLGVFKNFKFPRVIWIGIEENQTLRDLANDLKKLSDQLGIKTDEKEFSPHITLGRVKGNLSDKFIEFFKSYTFEPFSSKVESFELMESKLEKSGSVYTVKSRFELKEHS